MIQWLGRIMKVAVVLLTWKRLSSLQSTLNAFSRQTNKDFTLVISNGNLTKQGMAIVDKYAKIYKHRGRKAIVRHDGNEEYAFRRFYVGKDLADQGYDVILFIDDDVKIPTDYVDQCLDSYEPQTYKSGFAWIFYNRGRNYYKFRKRVFDNDHKVHYAGTGMSMIDASIFKDEELISGAPKGTQKIEDLWLSYYVYHKPGWRVLYMETNNVRLDGADSVALYKQVQREEMDKAKFLRLLVEMGWKIPAELPKEIFREEEAKSQKRNKAVVSQTPKIEDMTLSELARLKASGDLSNEEFLQLKRKATRRR